MMFIIYTAQDMVFCIIPKDMMVGRPRFERGTNGLKVRCSTS